MWLPQYRSGVSVEISYIVIHFCYTCSAVAGLKLLGGPTTSAKVTKF